MPRKSVAIISFEDDLHALAVQQELGKNFHCDCHIPTDKICGSARLGWSNRGDCIPTLPTTAGGSIDARSVDLIWWRRPNHIDIVDYVDNPAAIDLIRNDIKEALFGIVVNEFRGIWVSDPDASRRAENKLLQLKAAEQAGFRVPRTLVSQNPRDIREFCGHLGNQVVVKPVKGTTMTPIVTLNVTEPMLADDEALSVCPAIYQELIAGTCHIRANCFGNSIHAALIESPDLDWRPNLNVSFEIFEVPQDVKKRCGAVLNALGLRMGIFDLKLDKNGEAVWLEVNPQGQFLFIEGLTGLALMRKFCEFLCDQFALA
jgi:hypothetical protein